MGRRRRAEERLVSWEMQQGTRWPTSYLSYSSLVKDVSTTHYYGCQLLKAVLASLFSCRLPGIFMVPTGPSGDGWAGGKQGDVFIAFFLL